jgi:hypothetical protein
MEIKDEKSTITDIFLQSKRDDDELSYQTTSDYVSSDGKIKSTKKKMTSVKIIKKIDIKKEENIKQEEVIKKEDKRIIINKRNILLIKGRR